MVRYLSSALHTDYKKRSVITPQSTGVEDPLRKVTCRSCIAGVTETQALGAQSVKNRAARRIGIFINLVAPTGLLP